MQYPIYFDEMGEPFEVDARGNRLSIYRRRDGLSEFDFASLYDDRKYNIQGMVMREVGYAPSTGTLKKGYQCHSLWSDHSDQAWREDAKDLKSSYYNDAFWHGVTRTSLMRFARRMLAKHSTNKVQAIRSVVGARIVRYSNRGGWPVHRLDIIFKDSK